jgi:hypothetical protein
LHDQAQGLGLESEELGAGRFCSATDLSPAETGGSSHPPASKVARPARGQAKRMGRCDIMSAPRIRKLAVARKISAGHLLSP